MSLHLDKKKPLAAWSAAWGVLMLALLTVTVLTWSWADTARASSWRTALAALLTLLTLASAYLLFAALLRSWPHRQHEETTEGADATTVISAPRAVSKKHDRLIRTIAIGALDAVRAHRLPRFEADGTENPVFKEVLYRHYPSIAEPLDSFDAAWRQYGEARGRLDSRIFQELSKRDILGGPWNTQLGPMLGFWMESRQVTNTGLSPSLNWVLAVGNWHWGQAAEGTRVVAATGSTEEQEGRKRRFGVLVNEMISWTESRALRPAFLEQHRREYEAESALVLLLQRDTFHGLCSLCEPSTASGR